LGICVVSAQEAKTNTFTDHVLENSEYMITRYTEQFIRKPKRDLLFFTALIDTSIVVLALINYRRFEWPLWYLGLCVVLVGVLTAGTLIMVNKRRGVEFRRREHTLEISDNKLCFSWPDDSTELALKEVEQVIVKSNGQDISRIIIKTKAGREVLLEGYEKMQAVLDQIKRSVDGGKIR
jgi:hypothetical protein